GFGLLVSGLADAGGGSGGPAGPTASDPTALSLGGVSLAALAVAVLGVLMAAGEYSTGTIRATLAAVPTRLPVLWAKAVVFAGAVFAAMLVAVSAAFLAGQAVLSARGHTHVTLADPGV